MQKPPLKKGKSKHASVGRTACSGVSSCAPPARLADQPLNGETGPEASWRQGQSGQPGRRSEPASVAHAMASAIAAGSPAQGDGAVDNRHRHPLHGLAASLGRRCPHPPQPKPRPAFAMIRAIWRIATPGRSDRGEASGMTVAQTASSSRLEQKRIALMYGSTLKPSATKLLCPGACEGSASKVAAPPGSPSKLHKSCYLLTDQLPSSRPSRPPPRRPLRRWPGLRMCGQTSRNPHSKSMASIQARHGPELKLVCTRRTATGDESRTLAASWARMT